MPCQDLSAGLGRGDVGGCCEVPRWCGCRQVASLNQLQTLVSTVNARAASVLTTRAQKAKRVRKKHNQLEEPSRRNIPSLLLRFYSASLSSRFCVEQNRTKGVSSECGARGAVRKLRKSCLSRPSLFSQDPPTPTTCLSRANCSCSAWSRANSPCSRRWSRGGEVRRLGVVGFRMDTYV